MKHVFVLAFVFLYLHATAQKKKEIKKYGIKSIAVIETRGNKTINDSKTSFNSAGLVTEKVTYNPEGKQKYTVQYKYNGNGDAVEELEYDQKHSLKEKRVIKYNRLGYKIEELALNALGKITTKTVYTYNRQGLRIGKVIYDAANKMISSKKIVYLYN